VIDPSTWGITPQANFTIPQCREDTFNSHVIVFNIALCGDLAANTFVGNGCPGSCNDFVANNPAAMRDAWWGIRNMRVYNAKGSPVEECVLEYAVSRLLAELLPLTCLSSIALQGHATLGRGTNFGRLNRRRALRHDGPALLRLPQASRVRHSHDLHSVRAG
jgi:hypothetical protein